LNLLLLLPRSLLLLLLLRLLLLAGGLPRGKGLLSSVRIVMKEILVLYYTVFY
jgi:hypothetical protein